MQRWNRAIRKLRNTCRRRKLKNKDFSLFASNCVGAAISHDLGLEFRSPFVNLWLNAPDFVTLLESLKEYMDKPLEFVAAPEYSYPVAKLGELTVYFQHYASEEEAAGAWNRRRERINWDNLCVMMTQRDGCTEEVLRRFDALPCKKVVFTTTPRPDIASAVYIPGFEKAEQMGNVLEFAGRFSGKRYYDYFDYVKWLNEGR